MRVQQVKVPATQTNDLISITGTYMIEGGHRLSHVVSSTCIPWCMRLGLWLNKLKIVKCNTNQNQESL